MVFSNEITLFLPVMVLVADVVKVISELFLTTEHDQIRRHSTFCLLSLTKTLPHWSLHYQVTRLKETLEHHTRSLVDPQYEVSSGLVGTVLLNCCYYIHRKNKQLVKNC